MLIPHLGWEARPAPPGPGRLRVERINSLEKKSKTPGCCYKEEEECGAGRQKQQMPPQHFGETQREGRGKARGWCTFSEAEGPAASPAALTFCRLYRRRGAVVGLAVAM